MVTSGSGDAAPSSFLLASGSTGSMSSSKEIIHRKRNEFKQRTFSRSDLAEAARANWIYGINAPSPNPNTWQSALHSHPGLRCGFLFFISWRCRTIWRAKVSTPFAQIFQRIFENIPLGTDTVKQASSGSSNVCGNMLTFKIRRCCSWTADVVGHFTRRRSSALLRQAAAGGVRWNEAWCGGI